MKYKDWKAARLLALTGSMCFVFASFVLAQSNDGRTIERAGRKCP